MRRVTIHRLNINKTGICRLLVFSCLAFLCLAQTLTIAAGEKSEDDDITGSSQEPIEIVADNLITDNQAKYAEFTGQVKVTQGTYAMTCDILRIHYSGDFSIAEEQKDSAESIEKIIASGNVVISAEDYQAETEKAEYDMKQEVLVLTGQNTSVTSGQNSIVGSKITMFRKDGRVTVEGSSKKRVKAVFYSNQNLSDSVFGNQNSPQTTAPQDASASESSRPSQGE